MTQKSEPRPVIIAVKIVQDIQWICPHCLKQIQPGEIKVENGKVLHSCGNEIVPPGQPQQSMQDTIQGAVSKILGMEGNDKITVSGKPPILEDFVAGEVINEALPKSTVERINRRTRVVKNKKGKKMNPAADIHRPADNDPRQTSRGRQNFRGKKRRQDEYKRRHPEKFTEDIQFILNSVGKSIEVIHEGARKLRDPITTLEIIERLLDRNVVNKGDLRTLHDSLICYLEGKEYEFGPLFIRLGDSEGERIVLETAQQAAKRISKIYPGTWILREEDCKSKVVRFMVIGETALGEKYKKALNDGHTRSF